MFWNCLPKNRVSESTPKNQWFISRGPWIHRLGMLLLKYLYLESRALAQCKDIRRAFLLLILMLFVQFSNLVDRMRDRLQGWKSRTLTFAGRLTLIKSVTTAISNHVCSCFKIPQSVKMEGLKPHFLWSSGERDKTHMVSWSRVCRPT